MSVDKVVERSLESAGERRSQFALYHFQPLASCAFTFIEVIIFQRSSGSGNVGYPGDLVSYDDAHAQPYCLCSQCSIEPGIGH